MPLKRRKQGTEAAGSKEKAKEEEENDGQEHGRAKKKRNFANSFIVISDSDGEPTQKEKMEEPGRKAKQTVRSKLEEKRRIAQMTEEEQLELAVRMSEQEASQVTYQRDEEDELLKKAIAESLNNKSSSKGIKRKKAMSKMTRKEHAQPSLPEEDEDSGSSVATCPDSLPPSQPPSPLLDCKPTLNPVSANGCMSPLRTLNSASVPGPSSLSPTRKPASHLRVGSSRGSPVCTPAFQLLDGSSILSPVNKSISQLQDGVSGTSHTSNSDLPPLSEASSSSPTTKCTSQPISGVGVLLSPFRRLSPAVVGDGASCSSSPAKKTASQPLTGAISLSPFKKSASQPLDDLRSHSPISTYVSDNMDMGAKSPLVVLERLSQDIVESSSVVLSPTGKVTGSDLSQNPTSPALTDSSDFVPTTPLKHPFARSPTFPRVSLCIGQMAPRRLMSSLAKNETIENDLQKMPSDCVESTERESTSGSSTPDDVMDIQDEGVLGPGGTWLTQGRGVTNGQRRTKESPALQHRSLGAAQEQCSKLEDKGSVHYFWGIPFCPKGGDCNQYTKVILCQLEVYQKSLKQAQRQLLQKREYGPPILPSPPSSRRSDRSRGGEKDERSRENVWDDQSSQEGPMSDKSRESSRSPAAIEHPTPTDDEPTTSYMQTACVEQALNGSVTNGDAIDEEPLEDSPSASDASCGVQETPGGGATEEPREEEATVCPESQAILSSDAEPDRRVLPPCRSASPFQSAPTAPPEERESNDPTSVAVQSSMVEGQSTMADLESSVPEVTPIMDDIQCPLCGLRFSAEQIERHAADCDGSAEKRVKRQETPVLLRRRRGVNSAAPDVEDLLSSPDTGKRKPLVQDSPVLQFPGLGRCEKCYLCKELVPLRLYQGHVDSCLQAANLETQGSRTRRSTKEVKRCEGRLLSMLDQSETMSADAERRTSATRSGPLRSHEANEEEEVEGNGLKEPSSPEDFTTPAHFSNSPIKSFVCISEATDCLVDFKKQFSKTPGTGRGPSRGSGKRSRWRGKKR